MPLAWAALMKAADRTMPAASSLQRVMGNLQGMRPWALTLRLSGGRFGDGLILGFCGATRLHLIRDDHVGLLVIGNASFTHDQDVFRPVQFGGQLVSLVIPSKGSFCDHSEKEAVTIAGDMDHVGVIFAVRLPIPHELLPVRLRLASGQDSQQGSARGGNEISSVHEVSYGERLMGCLWCRLKIAQASATLLVGPAFVSQYARSDGFRMFHQAMPLASSAVGGRFRSEEFTDIALAPPFHVPAPGVARGDRSARRSGPRCAASRWVAGGGRRPHGCACCNTYAHLARNIRDPHAGSR